MTNDIGGVWRTIGGRRVFIKDGQNLASAMKESGKFKNLGRGDVVKAKQELKNRELHKQTKDMEYAFGDNRYKLGNDYWGEKWNEAMKYERQGKEDLENYDNPKDYKGDIGDVEGKHISKEQQRESIDREIEEWTRYRDKYQKSLNRATNPESKERFKKEIDDSNRTIERLKEQQKTTNNLKDKEMTHQEASKAQLKRAEKEYKDVSELRDEYEDRVLSKADEEEKNNKAPLTEEEYTKKIREIQDRPSYKEKMDQAVEDLNKKYGNNENVKNEKYSADSDFKKSHHLGWGDYNKDGIPVYDNKIDYKGDFGLANLKTLSNEELTQALNTQSKEYHSAMNEKLGDQRTRNGRMDAIFKNAKVGKYEQGMQKINEEMASRNMPRYNIYDKKNNTLMVSSPTKEMAETQLKDMYETDKKLQKSYGWKELPSYKLVEEKGGVDTINKKLQRAGYKKYMKEHPNSKMTFEEYIN